MQTVQSGILAEETALARYLMFSFEPGMDASAEDVRRALKTLAAGIDTGITVIGIGESLAALLGCEIPGLQTMPAQAVAGVEVPSSPMALWCWLRGHDRGEIFHRSRDIQAMLEPALMLEDVTDSFQYDQNRDLSGYVDGTENPAGDDAVAAAIVQGQGAGLDGGSFVTVQNWLHDFDALDAMSAAERDDVIGRRLSDNEEFDEAPESAHVKRSAQESFTPEAFILRRSMPWAEGTEAGLVFVAFGNSFAAFDAIFNRMLGREDGVMDALFSFTRPLTGARFWCPPMKDNELDLSALGI